MKRRLEKLDLNITNRCNFRCIHCCFDSGKKAMEELSFSEINKVLEDARELGAYRIDITGGETLVRHDLDKIIRRAKELGFRIELLTNASLLTKKRLLKLKAIGLDALGISLDGSNALTYNKIRKRDKKIFDKIIANIKECVNLGFYTKVNTVVFKSNLENIADITKLCKRLNVHEHGIYFFSPIGRGNTSKEEVVDHLVWLDYIQKNLSNTDTKLSIELVYAKKDNCKDKDTSCFVKNPHHLQILPDGNVFPCAIMASYNKPIGNVKKNSLKEIWHDNKLWQKYIKDLNSILRKYDGCINYSDCFKSDKKLKFICPCKKFSVNSIFENEK